MHALVIEDNSLIAMMIEEELRELGYTSFDLAEDQTGAIELAAIRCPNLITADDQLAEGSGIEAVRVICAHRAIPVVFITGNPHEVSIPDAVSLAKPFRADDLRAAIEMANTSARAYA